MTASDTPPPLTDEELAQYRDLIDMHRQYGPALSIEGEARLLAEVDRLRAELETVSDEAGNQCREAAARTVRAEKEAARLAAALDQFRSFPTDPGPLKWSSDYRMGYADAGRDVRAIAAALGETGGTDADPS